MRLVLSLNHEAGLLKLNCDKSLVLSWKASMNFEQTVGMTVDWYKSYNETPSNALELTLKQIKHIHLLPNRQVC